MIGNRSAAPMIRESLGRGMRLVNPLRVKLVELQGGEALVRLGDTAEIEPIRAALFAPGEQGELTVLACQVLGRLGDQQSQGAMFRLARPAGDDIRPIEIRLAALRALADLGTPDRNQLLEWSIPSLKDLSPMVRAQACFTVGAIGGDAAVRALVPLMADLDPNVQVAAAGAILSAHARR
jgi:HEAT repeat protein